MNHKERTVTVMERDVSQPFDQVSAIVCGEDILNRVFGTERYEAFCGSQQKEIMIAEDGMGCGAETLEKPQGGQ